MATLRHQFKPPYEHELGSEMRLGAQPQEPWQSVDQSQGPFWFQCQVLTVANFTYCTVLLTCIVLGKEAVNMAPGCGYGSTKKVIGLAGKKALSLMGRVLKLGYLKTMGFKTKMV